MSIKFNGTTINSIKYNGTSLTKVSYNGTLVWPDAPTSNCFCVENLNASNRCEVNLLSLNSHRPDLWYSPDEITWTLYDWTGVIGCFILPESKLYFKGNNPTGFNISSEKYCKFRFDKGVILSGNIMSLIDNGACSTTTIPNNFCFYDLFNGNTNGIYANSLELSATTLADYCYSGMFYGCTLLKSAPALPATTLAEHCYANMFYGCTDLRTAPSLPATTLASGCYSAMFRNCTSLTTAPTLPSTTLATNCYLFMFEGCTSLTTAPALPATTLATGCYDFMFYGCRLLIVSDTSSYPSSGFTKAWRIPSSGSFNISKVCTSTFYGCNSGNGRASYNLEAVAGQSKTYYTENIPV